MNTVSVGAVPVEEFVGKYQDLVFGNGASWARKEATLAKHYNVLRHKRGTGNRITHVELQGYAEKSAGKQIPIGIRTKIAAKRCLVLDTSNPECDHKIGHLDDPNISNQTMDDFQPLSKAANDAKRQHCKNCRRDGIRFDAKRLGYQVSQVRGNREYEGTCVGCYWHDPLFFNKEVSRNYSGS